jgi:hypothetical protein
MAFFELAFFFNFAIMTLSPAGDVRRVNPARRSVKLDGL